MGIAICIIPMRNTIRRLIMDSWQIILLILWVVGGIWYVGSLWNNLFDSFMDK